MTTMPRSPTRAVSRKVDEVAHRHPGLVTVARLGWVAKGVVYGVVGVLAVPIAIEGLQRRIEPGAAGRGQPDSARSPRSPTRRSARWRCGSSPSASRCTSCGG